jgi:hypothetical protein
MQGKVETVVFGEDENLQVPGGADLQTLVDWELRQAKDDGRNQDAVAQLAQLSRTDDKVALLDVYQQLLSLPISPDFPFTEPDALEDIRSLRPDVSTRQYPIPRSEEWLYDRLYGAWLGRCAGCTLGGPAEAFRPWTRQRLMDYLTAVSPDEWPIHDYMPEHSPSEVQITWKRDATREQLSYVPADDDLTHTLIAQVVLQSATHPTGFRTLDLARTWFRLMPYAVTAGGTGMLAYRNLVIRYPMRQVARAANDDSEFDWHWVATHSNPYREDIDAAIRADSYGYAAPGMSELAAELAWRDARLSNVKNGIYCSMFYAAMIAAAFALDDPLAIVEAGLAEIPHTSRLYDAAKTVIGICQQHGFRSDRIDSVHEAIYQALGDDHNATPNNMALVVSALLLGGGDFEKVITYTVMGGWDSDSTAATSGSIAGAMLGAKRLPDKWTVPLRDTLYGQVAGYHPIAVSELARRSVGIAKSVLYGG